MEKKFVPAFHNKTVMSGFASCNILTMQHCLAFSSPFDNGLTWDGGMLGGQYMSGGGGSFRGSPIGGIKTIIEEKTMVQS